MSGYELVLLINVNPLLSYGAAFAILLIEGTGFPLIPWQPVFLALGIGISLGKISLPAAVLAGAAGNVLGNLVGYLLGKSAGRYAAQRYGRYFGLEPDDLDRAERWFARYGGVTAFIARFFGLIRTPTILAAGAARMNLRSFTAWSFAGSSLWCLALLYISTEFGRTLIRLWSRNEVLTILTFVLAALGLPLLALVRRYIMRARRQQKRKA